MMLRLVWVVCLLIPCSALASVQLSEIAWMGSADSANHEWIELHNTGAAVDLTGWILHDANSLTIELEGTLAAGAYGVLERTSDASAPGAAFMLYTGALSNSGATLVLRDAAGVVVDQVNGGEHWENIGGNNDTKDTAQRSTDGWQTAPATPGSATVSGVSPTANESDEPNSSSGGTGVSVKRVADEARQLVLPDISLQLAVHAPSTVHAGQPVQFDVDPSGVGDTIADSLVYEWNFGNGASIAGKEAVYTYEHPGTYVVVVSGEYKRQKQWQRHEVTVLPVELQLDRRDGQYVITNTSTTEVDIGGYVLQGVSAYTFPKHTIILPNTAVSLSVDVSEGVPALAVLSDQQGAVIATYVPGLQVASHEPEQFATAVLRPVVSAVAQRAAATPPPTPPTSQFGFASDEVETAPVIQPAIIPAAPQPVAAPTNKNTDSTQSTHWPLLALVALLLLGTIGIYLMPKRNDSPPWV